MKENLRSMHFISLIVLPLILNFLFNSCSDELSVKYSNLPVIIIKADDLMDTTPNWNRFIKVVIDNQICAGIGVISKQLSSNKSISEIRRIAKIKQNNNFSVIEFWNHGYDHSKNGIETEFYGTDFEYQLSHIQKSQDFFIDSLQCISHSFGAPFNKTNSTTDSALKRYPDINVWMCYQKNEKENANKYWKDPKKKAIHSLDRNLILDVDYLFLKDFSMDVIKKNFNEDKKKQYILIQIHPQLWDNKSFDNFRKLIRFYKDQKRGVFMTPYQYYQFLHTKKSNPD
ncbi:MAG: hypothetical protein GZ091_02210 [Paludibacter sp.]|nr:hypothetical protein [Paludibacter sp.]